NMHEFAAWAKLRRAVHPCQHDARPIRAEDLPQAKACPEVEPSPERQLDRRHSLRPQRRRALGVLPDDDALLLTRAAQALSEPDKERLGAAVRRTCHRLRETDHGINASKRAATSSQESPFWRSIAARCRVRQSVSSLSKATAAATNASSSRATVPV